MQRVITVTQKNAVKKKLMAATSMLLVAAIMLISSTYAWFTLSTAPEVTGITTTVGANGNLEMALATTDTWGNAEPQSYVGSSMTVEEVVEANKTWGNLVDLDKRYGFENITLYPSRLNMSSSTLINTTNMLKTPSYGYDGRVSSLLANTVTGVYNGTTGFIVGTNYGVRGVGVASAMTDRQLAYRSALGTLSSNKSLAANAAAMSLSSNGSALADIVIKYATNGDAATFTQADVTVLKAVITDLKTAATYIKKACEATMIGYIASAAQEETIAEEAALAAISTIEAGNYTVSENTITVGSVTVTDATFGSMYKEYTDLAKAISDAETAATNLTAESITWAEFKAPLTYLIDPSVVTVNNVKAAELKNDDGLNKLVNDVLGGNGIQVQLISGSGAYADIADFCGDYSTTVTISEISYNGLSAKNVTATMIADSTLTTDVYLDNATTAVQGWGAPSSKTNAETAITDFYGYAIDMLFRTNAQGSTLQLQTDAAQRIYSDSENAATQGAGSNMTFTSTTLVKEDLAALMDAIRVVFMDETGNIISFAKLDVYDVDADNNKTLKVETTAEGTKADLILVGHEFNEDGSVKINAAKTSQNLISLPQNTKTRVTALVYLDGDVVDNSMVGATGFSMSGKMNLQFTSDANLVPMDNTELKGVTATEAPTQTP